MRFFNSRVAFAGVAACVLGLAVFAQTGGRGHGFDKSRMDETAAACTDFYQYANGSWLKTAEIPAAFPSWGSFNILAENNRNTLHTILDESSKNTTAKSGSTEQKIGDFYATCMDEQKREAAGAKPLAPYLARIDKVKDLKGLEAELGYMHHEGLPALFGFGAAPDFKNSSMQMGIAGQGGLSLPNKDYYTKTDEQSVKLREQFVQHVANMFQLLGDAPEVATKNAQTVMSIEMRLAQNSRGPIELRDVEKQYHIMSVADLDKLTPHFSWGDYFGTLGLSKTLQINMAHPEFFQAADKMLVEVPVEDWKTYLRWNLVNNTASALSANFQTEEFNFNGKTLQGRKEQNPLWRRCVSATDGNLGEALGQVYVARAFTPEAKQRMQTMVNNLIAAFNVRLTRADWMSDETRKAAIAKLAAFGQKIGYPDKWIDYSHLNISRDSYAANIIRASEFAQARDFAKIGKPIDKTEWGMTPPTVNAYNNWFRNEIVFPAGILQPPFFNPEADDAINYGSIGAVIGHEITHGFDDQGAKFDLAGNLKDWWLPADMKNFETRSNCIVTQFDAFEVEPGLHEQGKLVSGESIADLGGLTVAYTAYQKSLEGKPRPANIDGFTPEQRFFLGWAQVWAEKSTPQYERLIAQSNEHPLGRFRVNGPLSNMPEFAAAFQCKAGEPMVRPDKDRCQIW
ncbi:MAG: putative endopeptidase [Acidobacteriota bacterium]|jgi:putative endopeptidase|nr:putative endopeptidase [Acidobacteriota bacterium]MDT7806260.1 putative endopeptidase [Acidobacteriota bacterium]